MRDKNKKWNVYYFGKIVAASNKSQELPPGDKRQALEDAAKPKPGQETIDKKARQY